MNKIERYFLTEYELVKGLLWKYDHSNICKSHKYRYILRQDGDGINIGCSCGAIAHINE